ncbi:hypothetical protein CONLIGDRAFT_649930 [Coniochaeta ligniaria NRRL 30616]|uniref:Uncharacterized protein n=1 Tax=Coniochaeta ligniaria NRRL 30616 TaxID=1408157 RepID=A0A1J7I6V3_9PEZI|nr:hypothetical protein CONLIGDRAFT_649930 [Coniochaeta ligniaria NRRL 30616]
MNHWQMKRYIKVWQTCQPGSQTLHLQISRNVSTTKWIFESIEALLTDSPQHAMNCATAMYTLHTAYNLNHTRTRNAQLSQTDETHRLQNGLQAKALCIVSTVFTGVSQKQCRYSAKVVSLYAITPRVDRKQFRRNYTRPSPRPVLLLATSASSLHRGWPQREISLHPSGGEKRASQVHDKPFQGPDPPAPWRSPMPVTGRPTKLVVLDACVGA